MQDKIVFLDLETDRLDPQRANPIQIAAIAVDRGTLEELATFEVKIEFDIDAADPTALDRNCYNPDIWKRQARRPKVAMAGFSAFLKLHSTWVRTSRAGKTYTTCEIAGHNVAQYDAAVIENWYKRSGKFCPAATYTTGPVDTMHMDRCVEFAHNARWGHFSLDDLCARFGIQLENAHDALEDVRATVELAKALKALVNA